MRAKDIIPYLFLRLVVYYSQKLDDEEADKFGAWLGRVTHRLWKSRRLIALENFSNAFPEITDNAEKERIILRVFENFGRNLAEVARFPLYTAEWRRKMVTLGNSDFVRELFERKCGCMFVTPHFGNWELVGSWLPAQDYPTSFLAGAQSNLLINGYLNYLRSCIGVDIIQTGASARPVMSALKRGEFVGMVTDQHSAIGHEVVKFFGRDVAAHRGPALFAYRTGAAILPAFLVRVGPAKHEGWLEDPIFADRTKPEEEEIHALTQEIMSLFEKGIRKHPDCWMWTHRRWKPVPADSAPSSVESPAA